MNDKFKFLKEFFSIPAIKKSYTEFIAKQTIEKVSYIDAKTSDGYIVRSEGEDFTVGYLLILVNEDGTTTNATEGSYTLEDGRTIVVGAEGVITDVQDASTANEKDSVEVEQEKETETTDESKTEDKKVEQKKKVEPKKTEEKPNKEFEALKAEVKTLTETINEMKKNYESFSKELDELGKQPSDEKIISKDTSEESKDIGYKPRVRSSEAFNKLKIPKGK
jgi:hypothetical protein